MIEPAQVERIVEAALLAAGEPLSIDRLMGLFDKDELPAEDPRGALHQALHALDAKTQGRARLRAGTGRQRAFACRYARNSALGWGACSSNDRHATPVRCWRRWR